MERCKIVCSLDGKEPDLRLYGEYTDLSKRTFLNDRQAIPAHINLYKRARGMRWDSEKPTYHIVPVDEESSSVTPQNSHNINAR